MTITDKTLYEDFAPLEKVLTDGSVRELKASAERNYGNCYELTIDQFFGIANGDLSLLGDMQQPTVLQVYWQKRFAEFCTELTKACERLSIKEPNEAKISSGCVEMTALEGMLIFTREYFGLPSFFEAGKRTMGEYLTARKDKYNAARRQKNFEQIQREKLKTKR